MRAFDLGKLCRCAGACALAVALTAGIAGAQPRRDAKPVKVPAPADRPEKIPDTDVGGELDRIVRDLGGRDFAARQDASVRLSGNEQFTLELLERALERPNLTLEARTRIGAVARQRFMRSPRAALGFQFGGQLRDRVVVGETFKQFPCATILEEGDMIVGADGYKLEGPGARPLLQSVIVSHDPGERLHLTVRRGGEKMELDVPLGKFNDLPNAGGVMEGRLQQAWRVRSAARQGAAVRPIVIPGAPKAPWAASDEPAQRRAAMERAVNEPALQLAGGGMPRGAHPVDEDRIDQFFRTQLIRNARGQIVQVPVFRGDWDPEGGLAPMKPSEELAQLLDSERVYQQRMGDEDPEMVPLTDPRRAELKELKKTLGLIRKQKDAISAEMDEARAAKPGGTTKPGKQSSADANGQPNP